jgi:hypothetical protein
VEDPVKRLEQQATDWKKIFVNIISDREISKLSRKNQAIHQEKWAKDKNRHFTEENTQMANKHMQGCSVFSVIREIQIKNTVR